MPKQEPELLPFAVSIGADTARSRGRIIARFCHPGDAQKYAIESTRTHGMPHSVRDTSGRGRTLFVSSGAESDQK
jgi:hypothetical protein